MVYHINHKIGSDRHKKRECSCPFKRYDGMCSEKSNFPNQRCAVLNHTQKCLVHSSGSKFFFLCRSGNYRFKFSTTSSRYSVIIILLLKQSICDYIQSVIETWVFCLRLFRYTHTCILTLKRQIWTIKTSYICIIHCNHKCTISLLNNFCHHIKLVFNIFL